MLPSSFDYHRAGSLEEALSLLGQHGDDGKVLAGGQSLIPMMKLRFANPGHLIDVNHVDGLDAIEEVDGELRIGALVRHNHLAANPLIKERYPTIAAAAPQIADPLVRNLGTIGGSLAHADPAGDLGSVMLSLGASVVLTSASGERVVPIDEFIVGDVHHLDRADRAAHAGPRAGRAAPLRRHLPEARTQGRRLRDRRRRGGAHPVERLDRPRRASRSPASGFTNIHATDAEAALERSAAGRRAFAEAGRLAAAAADPVSDVRGPAEYKRHMVEVYVRRGLASALEMANAG